MNRGRTGSSPSARRISPMSTLTLSGWTWVSGQTLVEQRLPGDDVAGALDEHGEQVEGLVGERNPNLIPLEAFGWSGRARKAQNISRFQSVRPAIVTETGHATTAGRIRGAKSYRNPTDATTGWRSYLAPTVIQPLYPRVFVKNGGSSAGALASPVSGGPIGPSPASRHGRGPAALFSTCSAFIEARARVRVS